MPHAPAPPGWASAVGCMLVLYALLLLLLAWRPSWLRHCLPAPSHAHPTTTLDDPLVAAAT